ncbi:MAG: nitrile hydratase subunit alpha [Geodermatophilaceae bacterium]|nr:nitrile hydratase subunit alpha [Geodermatophilaceae bacterium]
MDTARYLQRSPADPAGLRTVGALPAPTGSGVGCAPTRTALWAEVDLSMGGGLQEQRLNVVENTAEAHNVIVCTLCSCYPIALLGPSPTWYKSEAYRSRVVREPRAVLAEFGFDLDPAIAITVWDASAESRYMVLPHRPEGTETLDETELAALVTRNGLIGVAPV